MNGHVSLHEFCQRVGIAHATGKTAAESGDLEAIQFNERWYVPDRIVAKWEANIQAAQTLKEPEDDV